MLSLLLLSLCQYALPSLVSFYFIPMCAGTLHSMICLSWFWSSTRMSYLVIFFVVYNELHRDLREYILPLFCFLFFGFLLQYYFNCCHFGCVNGDLFRQSPYCSDIHEYCSRDYLLSYIFDQSVRLFDILLYGEDVFSIPFTKFKF